MTKDAPKSAVLLIAYNRKNETVRQLHSLLMTGHTVYVSIDGPKNLFDSEIQDSLLTEIQIIAAKSEQKIHVRRHDVNLGLAKSVQVSIDWAFEYVENLVILEDDIVFDHRFLDFAKEGLSIYGTDDRVLLISGNQFFEDDAPENQLTSYPLIWGWATNKKKWSIMKELKVDSFPRRDKKTSRRIYSYWKLGYLRTMNQDVNSWILPIAAQMRLKNFFCVCPSINLTSNIGDDEFSTHTDSQSKGIRATISEGIPDIKRIQIDLEVAQKLNMKLEKYIYNIGVTQILTLFVYKIKTKRKQKC